MRRESVEDYMSLPYTVELVPDNDVGWFAKIKELPGCMSDGDTPDHAVANVRDAMHDWIAAALEDVGTIPLPTSMQKKPGTFLVRTSANRHQKLANMAREQGVSTNQLCSMLLETGVTHASDEEQVERLHKELAALRQDLATLSASVKRRQLLNESPSIHPDKVAHQRTKSADGLRHGHRRRPGRREMDRNLHI